MFNMNIALMHAQFVITLTYMYVKIDNVQIVQCHCTMYDDGKKKKKKKL